MSKAELLDRLTGFSELSSLPRGEMEWLVAHGELRLFEAGTTLVRKGEPLSWMYILLSGHIPVYMDLGTGPRLVKEWRPGDVTGLLPYSRAFISSTTVQVTEETEVFAVHAEHFPAMIRECPDVTTYVVHLMIDRVRSFNTSDLQEEKAISLGKLAAGLAHELNNPASATVRSAKLLLAGLPDADAAVRGLMRSPAATKAQLEAVERVREVCVATPAGAPRSAIEQADHESRIADWLAQHGSDPAYASPLAETAVDLTALDELARHWTGDSLDTALRWIAARCAIHALAFDIAGASTRIHDLVGAVKRFTYMDHLSAAEVVDVEQGLRDTLDVITSKTQAKDATVTLEVEPDLPRARAFGGDLNQVWLNLIDNALDAIPPAGHVVIRAGKELDRVVVRVVDDGSGIPAEIMPRIFDPFFTTKAPGQGTGLGLDLTRRLLRRYQGEVSVKSRPGRTEFRVSLEAEPAAQTTTRG